jgi:hypothetical protein
MVASAETPAGCFQTPQGACACFQGHDRFAVRAGWQGVEPVYELILYCPREAALMLGHCR